MQSALPLTGKCHNCGKPTPFRFCRGTSCQRMYYYRKQHPEVKRRPKRTERAFDYTSNFASWDRIEQNIERVVQKAKERGTCYG